MKTRLFLRLTKNPIADLTRGFSCHVGAWFKAYEDAVDFQIRNSTLTKPKFDKHSKRWCADPELGLSAFVVSNKQDFERTMDHFVSTYGATAGERISVFSSNDYDLGGGADGEDVFRNGIFLFQIDLDSDFSELALRGSSRPQ